MESLEIGSGAVAMLIEHCATLVAVAVSVAVVAELVVSVAVVAVFAVQVASVVVVVASVAVAVFAVQVAVAVAVVASVERWTHDDSHSSQIQHSEILGSPAAGCNTGYPVNSRSSPCPGQGSPDCVTLNFLKVHNNCCCCCVRSRVSVGARYSTLP